LKDQHNKVKQHAVELEAALAQRESVLVQLSAANQTVTQKHDQLTEEQMLRVRQLEEDLSNQTSLCDSLKAEVSVWFKLVTLASITIASTVIVCFSVS